MANADHPRLLLPRFISLDLCKELEFIHRSCGTVGYRPNVFSTTLSHLIATDCGHLILPFLSVRDAVREKVEDFFGCHFELFVEFTGLISWCKGACIGWHSDDNRPYLKQRDFAVCINPLAVCYLNSHGKDFKGGLFHFKDGEPSSVVPVAGDVLMYTADSRNIHSVDEVLDGERLTLTLWFSRNNEHDEDPKLISLLSQRLCNCEVERPNFYLPSPASDNMYWFSHDQFGFDIRYARINILGFHLFSSGNRPDSSLDPLDLLSKPLRLGRDDEIFNLEFANGLHALQVIQLYYWKAPLLSAARREAGSNMKPSQLFDMERMIVSELVLPCDHQLVEKVLSRISTDMVDISFSWDDFALAVEAWEEYVKSLQKDLLVLWPYWVSQQNIFFVNPSELQMCDKTAN